MHTPGPWLARDYKNDDGDIWIDCNSWRNPKTASCRGGTLATAHKNGAGEGTVEDNARLIAAAPEMVEAGLALAPMFDNDSPLLTVYRAEIEAFRAALAKATT